MKKVAILQSNYIPWKGYFDLIAAVDEFILYDEMQYTKNDWRNRNKIKTPNGVEWITIPVKHSLDLRICDIEPLNNLWQKKHWKTLEGNYRKAKFFDEISSWLRPIYLDTELTSLSEINKTFIVSICNYLGIRTKITDCKDYTITEGKTDRLVNLCNQAGASAYISGPAAKAYIDTQKFIDHSIKLHWFDYDGYQEYPQLWGEFAHGVSILDLLFNCGKDAINLMKYVKNDPI